MNTYNNPVLERLPRHLNQYVVEQNYARYSAIDQAIWRYVMRQNYAYLKDVAYYPYIPGLKIAGLSIERIPDLQLMNDSLKKIGWGAVTVDGFIPPAAFMEFQANCVLVIAADIRQIDHITYTPAPDIIHESSGHAPIIGEPEYADYLQYFGEIGSKAMSSAKDFEVYEAIRNLSILKESEEATEDEIKAASQHLDDVVASVGEPSEMSLLSRLHWWTVEYGLIGTVDNYKIYGAGLLSSIGESATCLKDDVKKLPYNMDAINYAYDITKPQPQLFVAKDFHEAYRVLDEFASGMAFKKGGKLGVDRAIESANVCTAVYSSGLEVSGTFVPFVSEEELIGVKTQGPTALAYQGKQLEGHGKSYHKDGFSSPVGRLLGQKKALEDCNPEELKQLGFNLTQPSSLYFKSGILVRGQVKNFLFKDNKLLIITFEDCTVIHEPSNQVLFQPEWGNYDMAIGEEIVSVYAGAADKFAFEPEVKITDLKTEKASLSTETSVLQEIYASLRSIREDKPAKETLYDLYEKLKNCYASDWLAMIEIYELSIHYDFTELSSFVEDVLYKKIETHPELEKLINDGMHLAKTQPINLELS